MRYVQTSENRCRDSWIPVGCYYDEVSDKRQISAGVPEAFRKTGAMGINRLADAVKTKRPRRLHPTRPDHHAFEVRNG